MNSKPKQANVEPAQPHLNFKSVRIAVACWAGVFCAALLPACGGGSAAPERKTLEFYMQAQGGAVDPTNASCAANASKYAFSQRWFEQEQLKKKLNLNVVSSECRYLPKVNTINPSGGLCLAQYRYLIEVENGKEEGLRTLLNTSIGEYAPMGEADMPPVLMFRWGARNSQVIGLTNPTEVSFPPSLTAGYLSCGG
jgi:hypothetical protein